MKVEGKPDKAQKGGGYLDVVTPVGEAPVRVFRRTFPLDIDTRGVADAIVIDPAETTVSATFEAITYEALAPPHPILEPSLDAPDGAVLVALDAPRRVNRVSITQGGEIRLHRLDGDKPVDDASVTAGSNARIGDDFTDRRFAIRRAGVNLTVADVTRLQLIGYPTGPRAGVAAPGAAEAVFFWRESGEIGKASADDPARPAGSAAIEDGAKLAAGLQRYVDALAPPLPANVAVDLVLESDAPCRVRHVTFGIDYLLVAESFSAPWFARGDVKDGAGLARTLREERDPMSRHLHARLTQAGRRLVELGDPDEAALVDELNALVAGAPLYDEAAYASAALSDETRAAGAAGSATGAALERLNRALLHEAYADQLAAPNEKRVLRFGGARTEVRELAIRLPADAAVTEARLETLETFRSDRGAGNGQLAEPAQTIGVQLDDDTRVASALTPAAPIAATGLALALLPTTERVELLVELHEDHGGTPAGRTLLETTTSLDGVSRAGWMTIAFSAPIVLEAQPHWVVVTAASGGAVWLAQPVAGDVRILERQGGRPRSAFTDLRPQHELLTRAEALQTQPATAVAVAGTVVEAYADGTYDLTAALNAFLGPQAGSAPVSVPLTFTSATAGSMTVQPPFVTYDLP